MLADDIKTAIENQPVRAFDIYALGPFLIAASFMSKKPLGRWPRRILFTAGVYSIIYNLKHYRAAIMQPDTGSEL